MEVSLYPPEVKSMGTTLARKSDTSSWNILCHSFALDIILTQLDRETTTERFGTSRTIPTKKKV